MQAINQRAGVAISFGQALCLRGMARQASGGIAARGIMGRDRLHGTLCCLPDKVRAQSNPRDGLQPVASNLFSWMVHRYD